MTVLTVASIRSSCYLHVRTLTIVGVVTTFSTHPLYTCIHVCQHPPLPPPSQILDSAPCRSFMETFPSSSPHIPRSASLGSGEAAAHNNISSNSSGVISGGSGRYPGFLDSPSFPTTPVLSSERKKMGSLRRIRKAVKKRRHRTGSMEDLSSSATGSSGPGENTSPNRRTKNKVFYVELVGHFFIHVRTCICMATCII